MEQYRPRLTRAEVDTEGWRMLRFVGGELARKGRIGELVTFCIHVFVRLVGNRIGKIIDKRSRKSG